MHILFALLIKKPPKNRYTRKQPIHFSMIPKSELKKKWKSQILEIGMPKKITPKPQAKNKNPISIIPIFSYFLTLKKYHANKYTI